MNKKLVYAIAVVLTIVSAVAFNVSETQKESEHNVKSDFSRFKKRKNCQKADKMKSRKKVTLYMKI